MSSTLLKVRQPIVVEGRYDRIRLSSVVDGVILETGGFRIFKDKELLAALRRLAAGDGLILLTDSDAAGFRIRNYLKGALGQNAKLIQVYIPGLRGVERRKRAPSAEGLLGVEGLDAQTLREAFLRAGVGCETVARKSSLTAADLLQAGLTGVPNSADRRRALLQSLNLPSRLSNKTMLQFLEGLLSREEFFALAAQLQLPHENTKREI